MATENYNNLTPNDKWRKAILSLKPNSKWSALDQELTWLDSSQTEPTATEIANEITRLEGVATSEEYKRKRAVEYPSLQEQLDMQYWDKKNGTTTWVDAIAKVKSDNPKP